MYVTIFSKLLQHLLSLGIFIPFDLQHNKMLNFKPREMYSDNLTYNTAEMIQVHFCFPKSKTTLFNVICNKLTNAWGVVIRTKIKVKKFLMKIKYI